MNVTLHDPSYMTRCSTAAAHQKLRREVEATSIPARPEAETAVATGELCQALVRLGAVEAAALANSPADGF